MPETGGGYPAITIMQPWASAIIRGLKPVENRSWPTNYRGRLWIHAGKKVDDSPRATRLCRGIISDRLEGGVILGSVRLTECVRGWESDWAVPGMYQWVLEDPEPLAVPVPCRGNQGLWPVPDHVRLEGP